MYVPRKVLATVALILGIGVTAWLVDSAVAARVEHRISEAVAERARLETNPGIQAAGVPYLQALVTGDLPMVSADALDVDVPGLGMVNARSEVRDLIVEPGQVFNGDIVGAPAEMITRTISLDGVALGHHLGLTDLDIAHPYDISPSGGRASEAQFTATPPDFGETVTVIASLRLDGPTFRMEPREMVDVPEHLVDATREIFTWELDTRTLPLADRAQAVYLQGGSIYFQAQKRNAEVKLEDLSPIEQSPTPEETTGGESQAAAAPPTP